MEGGLAICGIAVALAGSSPPIATGTRAAGKPYRAIWSVLVSQRLGASVGSDLSSHESLYTLMSAPAHGLRLNSFNGMVTEANVTDEQGRHLAKMSGFGLPPEAAIGLAGAAVVKPASALAGSDGIPIAKLIELGRALQNLI